MRHGFRLRLAIAAFVALAVVPASPAAAEDEVHEVELVGTGNYCTLHRQSDILICSETEQGLAKAESAVLDAETLAATTLLVTFYDQASYGTANGYYSIRDAPCTASTADVDLSAPSLGAWADRISSFKTHSTCLVKLYDGTSFTGTSFGYAPSTANLGSMDNKASSYRLT